MIFDILTSDSVLVDLKKDSYVELNYLNVNDDTVLS